MTLFAIHAFTLIIQSAVLEEIKFVIILSGNRFYKIGANRERELVNQARKNGYFAMRSAGSHSKIDLVRVINDTIEFIQVKSSDQKVEMPDFPKVLNVRKILAYKEKGKWIFKEL